MFRLTIIVLVLIFKFTSAQRADCIFYQNVRVGIRYDVTSPKYPDYYPPGIQCRWTGLCPDNYNCVLECPEIDLPNSVGCSQDRILISRSGDPQFEDAEQYCGRGNNLTFTSIKDSITMGLYSPQDSDGGRFACTLTAKRQSLVSRLLSSV